MKNYHQPQFYRFSEDSIILARKGYELLTNALKEKYEDIVLVDAFSGVGVVGLEFLILLENIEKIKRVYFIEKNKNMISYCNKNLAEFKLNIKSNGLIFDIINQDFFNMEPVGFKKASMTFFLINPPYFNYNPKQKTKRYDRQIARFFEKGFSVFDVLKKVDEIADNKKVAGLALYRLDQAKIDFTEDLSKKLKNIKVSKCDDSRLNSFTSFIYFES